MEPEIAYRMLNLERPSDYHEILREMFTGATRRLVANLSLDDCQIRRKDALATELMSEVAPVVQGSGQPQDGTDQGWGVVIDTIEVQDVRILSEEVFSRLQAPYREGLALEAVRAKAEVVQERALIEAEQARAKEQQRRELMTIEEARLEAERERARQRLAHLQQLKRLTQESDATIKRAAQEAALAFEQRNAEAEVARTQFGVEARAQRDQIEAEARAGRVKMEAEARAQRERMLAEAGVETAKLRAQAQREEGAAVAEVKRLERAALDQVSAARLQEIALTESLPRMAAAFSDSVQQATVISGDMSFLGMGMAQAVASLKSVGLDLGKVLEG